MNDNAMDKLLQAQYQAEKAELHLPPPPPRPLVLVAKKENRLGSIIAIASLTVLFPLSLLSAQVQSPMETLMSQNGPQLIKKAEALAQKIYQSLGAHYAPKPLKGVEDEKN